MASQNPPGWDQSAPNTYAGAPLAASGTANGNVGQGNPSAGAQGSRGNTLFPRAALFYHKLTNVAYHRQKLRRIKYDEIRSLFYEEKVGEYMLDVFSVPPKSEDHRRMIERAEVPGVSADDLRRQPELRADILAFSDQYELIGSRVWIMSCSLYVILVFCENWRGVIPPRGAITTT